MKLNKNACRMENDKSQMKRRGICVQLVFVGQRGAEKAREHERDVCVEQEMGSAAWGLCVSRKDEMCLTDAMQEEGEGSLI